MLAAETMAAVEIAAVAGNPAKLTIENPRVIDSGIFLFSLPPRGRALEKAAFYEEGAGDGGERAGTHLELGPAFV